MSDEKLFSTDREPPQFDDLDMDFDDEQDENRLLKLMSGGFVLVAVLGFVWLAWYAYQSGTQPVTEEEIPLVDADASPMKTAPEEPGGLQFDHQDKSVYNQLSGEDRPVAERLMPAPEEPVQRPGVEEILASQEKEEAATAAATSATVEEETKLTTVETLIAPEKPKAEAVKKEEVAPKVEIAKVAETPKPAADDIAKEITKEAVKPTEAAKPVEASKPVVTTEVASTKEPEKTVTVVEPKPVEALKPVAASTPKAVSSPVTSSAAGVGEYMLQLGAYRSQKEADAAWNKVSSAHSAMMPTKQHHVERADLGAKGVYYRLQVGPFSSDVAAKKLCEYLQQHKQGCFVVKGR